MYTSCEKGFNKVYKKNKKIFKSMNIDNFFIEVLLIAWIPVICPVTLGLAWGQPKPDLPYRRSGFARDIKPLFPLEHKVIIGLIQSKLSLF